ncbi:MAG: response regulator transcription factor [Clostridia bacterium]|nr:response regulator transcription factor [Clostridia bacterium]
MVNILVAEDDINLNNLVCSSLIRSGFSACGCFNGEEALKKLTEEKFGMIVSDVMMPSLDGFALAAEVRRTDKNIPILFITARDDMPSKQLGFSLGIDDYLVKPFVMDELILRVKALLRRADIKNSGKIAIGNLVMDEEEHTAYADGEELPLTVREFDLLFKLLSYPKKTFTRSQLMDALWDYDSSATSRTVDVYMAKLREKTAVCDGFKLVTVHGLGYKAVLK